MSESILQRTTPAVKNLIIINALAYFAQQVVTETPWGSLTEMFALHSIRTEWFKPYQVITHMFMHGSLFHLLFNMLALWMFGTILERIWGTKRFLIFYFICGFAAAITQMFTFTPAIGASGAIMGVAAAFAVLFPNTPLFIFPIPFPIKAKWAILGYFAFDLFSGIAQVSGDNIAHFAHLGGGIAGFLLTKYFNRNRRNFY